MHNFKQLIVWQKAIHLSIKIYKFSNNLNPKDKFVLSSQLVRCAFSIPSNIAEGSGKESKKDFCRYLNISTGSSFELETQLIILKNLQLYDVDEIQLLLNDVLELQKMIFGLKNRLISEQTSKSLLNKLKPLLLILKSWFLALGS